MLSDVDRRPAHMGLWIKHVALIKNNLALKCQRPLRSITNPPPPRSITPASHRVQGKGSLISAGNIQRMYSVCMIHCWTCCVELNKTAIGAQGNANGVCQGVDVVWEHSFGPLVFLPEHLTQALQHTLLWFVLVLVFLLVHDLGFLRPAQGTVLLFIINQPAA